MLKDATTFLGRAHLAIRTFLIFLTFFTTCHIRCMCNLTRLKVKPLRAVRQQQKTLTKQTKASNLFPVWQRPLQGLHADSLSLFLSRDISWIFCIVSSTSSTSPRCGPRWPLLISTSWQANDVTATFEDHVTPASRRELLGQSHPTSVPNILRNSFGSLPLLMLQIRKALKLPRVKGEVHDLTLVRVLWSKDTKKKATPEWLGGILHTKCGRAWSG